MIRLVLSVLLVLLVATPAHALVVDYTKGTFSWTWTPGTGSPATSFNMKCGAATGVYTVVKSYVNPTPTVPTSMTKPISDLITTPGTYFCNVTAVSQFGLESSPDGEVTFQGDTTPSPATGLTVK